MQEFCLEPECLAPNAHAARMASSGTVFDCTGMGFVKSKFHFPHQMFR